MRRFTILVAVVTLSLLFVDSAFAITCKELNTTQKIREFTKRSKDSNPLFRKRISSRLEMKTNDRSKKKKSLIHNLRMDERKRTYFIKGKDAPLCMISIDKKDFKCNECTLLTNSQCRSYKQDEDSTTIKGTNIDTKDVERVESEEYESVCQNIKKRKNYIKIVSKRVKGDSPYEKIESFYLKDKEVNILMNMFSGKVLRKVYKYSPKYFIKFDAGWMSTVTRVRTVKGKWKKYSFETLVIVKKNKKKKFMLYTNPTTDPNLKNTDLDLLFNTN